MKRIWLFRRGFRHFQAVKILLTILSLNIRDLMKYLRHKISIFTNVRFVFSIRTVKCHISVVYVVRAIKCIDYSIFRYIIPNFSKQIQKELSRSVYTINCQYKYIWNFSLKATGSFCIYDAINSFLLLFFATLSS